MERKSAHAAEQERPDVLRRRWDRFEGQLDLDPARLVFVDETWPAPAWPALMAVRRRGERLRAGVPHGHWKATTFVAGLRHTGVVAPMVLDGPIDGATFQAHVDRVLVPGLRRGDVVTLDNPGSHKVAGVREAVEARGAAILGLPPYPPDLDPTELAFSKLKRLLRSAAEGTTEGLWRAVAALLERFTPGECAAYSRLCGWPRSTWNGSSQRAEPGRGA